MKRGDFPFFSPDFRKGKTLGPDEALISWRKPAKCPKGCSPQDFAAMPDSLTPRQLARG